MLTCTCTAAYCPPVSTLSVKFVQPQEPKLHQQVLLDYGGSGGGGGPPFHILLNGTTVPRGHSLYPKEAYKEYCCPCTSCDECHKLHLGCCDALSNPNGQSIYKIHPHPVWAVHGFPANASDGFVGDPKMHELNVGALWKQIWCASAGFAKRARRHRSPLWESPASYTDLY